MSGRELSDFTKDSFLDYDQRRATFGSQPVGTEVGQPPVPNVERVLKVSIPFEPEWNKDMNGSYRLNLTSTGEQAEIHPCGYVNLDDLDKFLKERLCALPMIGINGPRITGSGRQLIDIDAPLYATLFEEAEVPEEVSIPHPDLDSLERMTKLLDAHERDPDTRGSHADTILNPETRAIMIDENIALLFTYLTNRQTTPNRTPVRSPVYNELYAMVAERRENPKLAERWALDSHRKSATDPKYSLALEILTWLRDEHRLSYDEITRLLDMCRRNAVAINPTQVLSFVINDLASGMPVEDIPYHSSLFEYKNIDTRPDPDGVFKKRTNNLDGNLSRRLFSTTFETISLADKTVIKEWWTRDPPAVFPLPVIRTLILLRDLANWSESRYDQPLIATTAPRSPSTPGDRGYLAYDGDVIAGLRYQDPRSSISQHPLRAPMEGPLSSEKIGKMSQRRDGSDSLLSYWQLITAEVTRDMYNFSGGEELADWMTGAAPPDLKLKEVIRWFL